MTGARGRDLARRVSGLAGAPVAGLAPLGSQHLWGHFRAVLADGREVFVKAADSGLGGVFEAEARGLRWLAQAGGAPVPAVLGWDDATLLVDWVPAGPPDRSSAERLGADLARTHGAGAEAFGAPWPGFIASLPLPNDADADGTGPGDGRRPAAGASAASWPEWFATRRLAPYLRRAADAGALSAADVALVEAVMDRITAFAGPPEPPSRIHGDCWSGNVIWSAGRGWLVDPAAHGGHRESDLAMLALFGAPYLEAIMAGYQAVAPLAAGWRRRVPLHQLHPLLVHVCLFGGGYRDSVTAAARTLLAA